MNSMLNGYVDLTVEELLALARAAQVEPPLQLMPTSGEHPAKSTMDAAADVGRRVLIARGFAREGDRRDMVDAGLLSALRCTAAAPLVAVVLTLGNASEASWLYLSEAVCVVTTPAGAGNVRMRMTPMSELRSVLARLLEIPPVLGPSGDSRVVLNVDGLNRAVADGRIGPQTSQEEVFAALDVDASDAPWAADVLGGDASLHGVIVLRQDLKDVGETRATWWLQAPGSGITLLEPADEQISMSAVSDSAVLFAAIEEAMTR